MSDPQWNEPFFYGTLTPLLTNITLMETQEEPQLTKKQRRDLKKQEKLISRESSRRKKQGMTWTIFIIVLILVVGGVIGIVAGSKKGSTTTNTSSASVTINDADWTTGPKDAKVTLVEYSDFQCPACGFFYPIVKQLTTDYADKFLFVYREYPLTTVHKNAQIAAQAGEAAGLQNKFWEMHDMLFENQADWSTLSDPKSMFADYAKTLGMDQEKFKTDLTGDVVKKNVSDDVNSGNAASVDATPTFFLQGKKVENPPSTIEGFKTMIDTAVAEAGSTTNTNTNEATNGNVNQ